MIELTNALSGISYVIGIVGIIGGLIGLFRFGDYKTTVKLQNDNIKALKDHNDIVDQQLKDAQAAQVESTKAISNLEGKLQAYKEIPLQEISTSLSKLVTSQERLVTSNNEILNTLRTSAGIAASSAAGDGLLVKTKPGQETTVKVTN